MWKIITRTLSDNSKVFNVEDTYGNYIEATDEDDALYILDKLLSGTCLQVVQPIPEIVRTFVNDK